MNVWNLLTQTILGHGRPSPAAHAQGASLRARSLSSLNLLWRKCIRRKNWLWQKTFPTPYRELARIWRRRQVVSRVCPSGIWTGRTLDSAGHMLWIHSCCHLLHDTFNCSIHPAGWV